MLGAMLGSQDGAWGGLTLGDAKRSMIAIEAAEGEVRLRQMEHDRAQIDLTRAIQARDSAIAARDSAVEAAESAFARRAEAKRALDRAKETLEALRARVTLTVDLSRAEAELLRALIGGMNGVTAAERANQNTYEMSKNRATPARFTSDVAGGALHALYLALRRAEGLA